MAKGSVKNNFNSHKQRVMSSQKMQTADGLIQYTLVYKSIKNIHFRINDNAELIVSCPHGTSVAYIQNLVNEKRSWILSKQNEANNSHRAQLLNADEVQRKEWKSRLQEIVPLLVDKWAARMNVEVSEIRYRNMTRSWGNCRPAIRCVTFNVKLAAYPDDCIEYVVVHELCHLLEPSHNARFKALMSLYLPNWKELKKQLS